MLAGNGRGQADAGDVFRAEGRRREDAHHGGIDAAAERDQALLEAALVRVVPQAEHQGLEDVLHFRLGVGLRDLRPGAPALQQRGEIDDPQLLPESRQARDHLALGGRHDRTAVKDQFIIAADHVAVDHGAADFFCGVGHQDFSNVAFAVVPGAG